jgi:hypothetical protein
MESLAARIGEISMPRKIAVSTAEIVRSRQSLAEQVDLFVSQSRGVGPAWTDLPKEARETLVGLMTQLLLGHGRAAKMEDADHDH